jgi:hypothetical protein
VAARLDAKDATEVAATLAQAMNNTTDPDSLAQCLSAVAARLDAEDAAEAAATLTRAMTKTTDPNDLRSLAQGLTAVAARLDAKEAARVSAEAAATLTRAMTKTDNHYALGRLAQCLLAVAARLDAKEAARVSAEAAATLTRAMTKTTDPNDLRSLAQGLTAVAARLDAEDAARVSAEVAATLTRAMTIPINDITIQILARGLAAVVARLEPKDAARAFATLAQAVSKMNGPVNRAAALESLSAVAAALDGADTAAMLMQEMTQTNDYNALPYLTQGLSAVLQRETSDRRLQRVYGASSLVGLGASTMVLAPTTALPHPAAQPSREALPTPVLVELLKHPLCVGEARHAVLDVLGTRYGRTFADVWEFVRYAEEQKLGLDFTTPPRRPE